MLNPKTQIITKRTGPLWQKSQYRDTKDPCPVYDGTTWHIYGSGGSVGGEIQEEWGILHATAPDIDGPWTEQQTVELKGLKGKHIAAPGVVYENGMFHMLVQTEFLEPGGTIEYLTSKDGNIFERQGTALRSIPETEEAALYDPHQAVIHGKKYFTYSGSSFIGAQDYEGAPEGWAPSVGMPDIYLAVSESSTWAGPWRRVGKILDHEDVVHHNQRGHLSYEWGLEGSQLIELPNGIILMNAVCFLPHGPYGTRQRIFFAFASKVTGPYYTAGTIVSPDADEWGNGENGHAAAFMRGPNLVLFYQGRPPELKPWRYGIAYMNVSVVEKIGKSTLKYYKTLAKVANDKERIELSKLRDKILYSKPIMPMTEYTRELRSVLRRYRIGGREQ